MKCTHDLAEKETAIAWDGWCPICLEEELAIAHEIISDLRQLITKQAMELQDNDE